MSKMKNSISRLRKWAKGGKASPETVQIYPTNKCNLRCIFCYQQLKEYDLTNSVTEKKWLETVEEICEMDTNQILISGGGEPLCEPKTTIKMMGIIKRNGLSGRLINNGTLWTDELIEKTVDMGWDNIMFSIDGPDAETHDYLRGVDGAFDKAIENIEKFNKMKSKTSSEKPIIEITSVLCNKNYDKISDMIKLCKKISINHLNLEPICVNNPNTLELKLNKRNREMFFKKIIPESIKLADKFKISTNFNKLKKVKYIEKTGEFKEQILSSVENVENTDPFMNLPCYEPWLWPKIEANGDVWPCSTVPLKINIKNKTFSEIWYGKEFNEFRRRIMDRDLPEDCENCVSTHLPINKMLSEKLKSELQ